MRKTMYIIIATVLIVLIIGGAFAGVYLSKYIPALQILME